MVSSCDSESSFQFGKELGIRKFMRKLLHYGSLIVTSHDRSVQIFGVEAQTEFAFTFANIHSAVNSFCTLTYSANDALFHHLPCCGADKRVDPANVFS